MADRLRALDEQRRPGYSEAKLGQDDPRSEPNASRRGALDAQTKTDSLGERVAVLEKTAQRLRTAIRIDIEAGQATATPPDEAAVSVSGTNVVVSYRAPQPAGRRVWLSDQRGGSALVFRLAANDPLRMEITAFDLTGASVSLAVGTHSVALEVWE